MPEGANGVVPDRASAITGFAESLRCLRRSAGNPSFREMSGRSRAISHTTLHEAAQGNRLPSWSTTVEFVKACGGDPDDFREEWDSANRAVQGATSTAATSRPDETTAAAIPADTDTADDTTDDTTDDTELPTATATDPGPRRHWYALAGAAAVVAVAAAVIGFVVAAGSDDRPAGPAAANRAAQLDAKPAAPDCPIQQTSPPYSPPAHPGDHARFIGDITVPDCQHVARGQEFTKVWRLKNAGTVTWNGYSLRRQDLPAGRDDCQTITDVPIARTAPGQMVDIRTEVTAPQEAGFCFVRFRIVDATGADAFPAGRPLNFQVIVD